LRVEKLLKRLKREFVKVNILQASLDSIIFFLISNLILFLFSLQLIEGFSNIEALTGATLIFFILDLGYRTKNYRLEIYEEKNPELHEVLRTARDNISSNNIVSQALFDDLLERSRAITSESIVPSKIIIQKSIAVGLLSFLTVTSGIADFHIQGNGGEILPGTDSIQDFISDDTDEEFELRNDTDIFGEPQDIGEPGSTVDFNITGEGESTESDPLHRDLQEEDIVMDASGPQTVEDIELAKEYMLAIRELED